MRAVVVVEPGRVELIDLPKPQPGPYQALVRTDVAAICNATDGKLVAGHFPGVDRYPLALGHESTGIVEAVGENVRTFRIGQRVIGGLLFDFAHPNLASGWGGFCEYTLVNDHDAMLADGRADAQHGWLECYEIQRAVDDDLTPPEAVLLCTWREVLGAFGDFHLQPDQRVLVFGAGPVGLSFVRFGRLIGLKWIGVVDPLPAKRARAMKLGADQVFAPGELPDACAAAVGPRGLDAAIDAVGHPACIRAGLPLVRMGGSLCVYGVLAEDHITIDKSTGPYNFNLFVHQWPTRWREREAQPLLSQWIREGKLRASDFVSHEFPVEEITAALAAVRGGDVIKCLLNFS